MECSERAGEWTRGERMVLILEWCGGACRKLEWYYKACGLWKEENNGVRKEGSVAIADKRRVYDVWLQRKVEVYARNKEMINQAKMGYV